MSLFKSKITYDDFLKTLFIGNIAWYNALLKTDDSFSKDVHVKMCIFYFNVSLLTYFYIGTLRYSEKFPDIYNDVDIISSFHNSLATATLEYGYNEEQTQVFLTEFKNACSCFSVYQERFNENDFNEKNADANLLKGFAVNEIMEFLINEELIDGNDGYANMHTQVCKFINDIILENIDVYKKLFNKSKFI